MKFDSISEFVTIVFRDVFIGMILVVVLPTTILGVIASGSFSIPVLLGAMFLMAILQFLPNALNNHSDWKIDEINGKRLKMHEKISKNELLGASLFLFLLTLPFFYFGNIYLKITMIFAYFFILNYSHFINAKNILILNYAFIAFFYGSLAFSIGFFFASSNLAMFSSLIWVPIFLFFVYMGMSVNKDYEDVLGDKQEGKITIPVAFGKDYSLAYQFTVLTLSFFSVLYFELISSKFLAFVVLGALYLLAIYSLWLVRETEDKTKYHNAHNLIRFDALLVTLSLSIFFFFHLL